MIGHPDKLEKLIEYIINQLNKNEEVDQNRWFKYYFNFKIFIGILLFQVKFFLVNLINWPISYLKKVMMMIRIRAKKTKKKNLNKNQKVKMRKVIKMKQKVQKSKLPKLWKLLENKKNNHRVKKNILMM